MRARYPNFVGIGAQKAGTTWLYTRLARHPQIWLPPIKELHYFSRDPRYPSPSVLAEPSLLTRLTDGQEKHRVHKREGKRVIRAALRAGRLREAAWYLRWYFGHYDDRWYARLFAAGRGRPLRGEITPAYSMLDDADVAAIRRVNPDMKIVLLLRDPIERAWSALRYDVDRDFVALDLTTEDAVIAAAQGPRMRLRGDYERTLDVYERHFGGGQLLVGFYDAIAADAAGLLAGITGFLGVEPLPAALLDAHERVNATPPQPMPDTVRRFLVDTYAPMTERLARRFGGYAQDWLDALNGTSGRATGERSAVVVL